MSSSPHTIGVITGRDLLGDALLKLPFARALRNAFPHAQIAWITSQGPTAFGGVMRMATSPFIDRIYQQPDWLPTESHNSMGAEKSPTFDLLFDTRNRWREARRARKVPHKIFIAPAAHYLFSEKRPFIFKKRPRHLCDRLLEMVELAAGYMPPWTGSLLVPSEFHEQAQKILPKGPSYVGFAPGAGNLIKIWPRWKFEKVAQMQVEKGRVPVFILGPNETDLLDVIKVSVPEAQFPLQEYDVWGTQTLGIDPTLAVGQCLDVAVCNDSGAAHILAAVDCPILSLFGPTSPIKSAPRTRYARTICAQTYGSSKMKAIRWEAVNEVLDEMLRQS